MEHQQHYHYHTHNADVDRTTARVLLIYKRAHTERVPSIYYNLYLCMVGSLFLLVHAVSVHSLLYKSLSIENIYLN